MTGLLVLTAVEFEASALARELELPRAARFSFPAYERARPAASGHRMLRVAPVGLRAQLLSERWAALERGFAAPLVISAGTCGALAPTLSVGDLVLPESVIGPSGRRLNVTPGAHRAAVEVAGAAETGLLLGSAEVVPTSEAKTERWLTTRAVAVDMESETILEWAARHGCPSLVTRAVSDAASQELSAALVGLVDRAGRVRTARALALAFTRPRTIARALVLRRGAGLALKSVARLIAALAG